MSDLISRQDAITIPVMPKEHRQYQTMNIDDAYERGWYDLQDCIESLPSAEPKTGEWMLEEQKSQNHVENIYICSACRNFEAWGKTELYNYCPNCGADMRGEKHE